MPTGEGWFLDVRTGKAIEILEHETTVRANPGRFRIRQQETEGRNRSELLALVCERGFVRVRWDKNGVVCEFHGGREKALRLIRRFLVTQGVGPITVVTINDLADDEFRVIGSWQEVRPRLRGRRARTAASKEGEEQPIG